VAARWAQKSVCGASLIWAARATTKSRQWLTQSTSVIGSTAPILRAEGDSPSRGQDLRLRVVQPASDGEFSASQRTALKPYFTNLDGPVFCLLNMPEVVKGALFSRYSRTEKSLRRVLLDEFLDRVVPPSAVGEGVGAESAVASDRAEEFYERILVGYGDDSVAELAGAHLALERVSTLAAKSLEDSRIGLSPLEKSTRYVRFDRPGADGKALYYRGPELNHPGYEPAMGELFATYSGLLEPLTETIRGQHPRRTDESERAWKSATRAKALDLLRGLLPAATQTNLGLFGNGRAFEYLITKMSAHELPECRRLAVDMHRELSLVIPTFVRRSLDAGHGRLAAARMVRVREELAGLAPAPTPVPAEVGVRLVEFDPEAEAKVVAAALFPHSDLPLLDLAWRDVNSDRVLEALLGGRENRRQRPPRALEHATYTFEIVANFAAYRDLQRHRMLTQDRQLLGTELGYDVPDLIRTHGMEVKFRSAIEGAARAQRSLASSAGRELAQYAVPLAFRLRWYVRANLREIYHLCELRTAPQGHVDYRSLAQRIFRCVEEVHPRLTVHADFVDMGPGDELERRTSEMRLDQKRAAVGQSSEPRA